MKARAWVVASCVAAASAALYGCPDAAPYVAATGGSGGTKPSADSSSSSGSTTTSSSSVSGSPASSTSSTSSASGSSSSGVSCTNGPVFSTPAGYDALMIGVDAIITLDVNGDSHPDLAVVTPVGSCPCVALLINDGKGNFMVDANHYSVTAGTALASADFDGDTKADIVAVGNGTASVFTNMGSSGAFSGPNTYGVGANPLGVVALDLNKDGHPDIAVSDAAGSVTVLLNNASSPGSFLPTGAPSYPAGADARALAAADLNGDGYPELVVADFTSGNAQVLVNDGTGAFGTPQPFGCGASPNAIILSDLNGDKAPDIVVANAQGVTVLLADGDASFAAKSDYPTTIVPRGVAAADVNHDGIVDIIAVLGDSTFGVFLGKGDGTFKNVVTGSSGVQSGSSLVALDLDGDGKADLAFGDSSGGETTVLLNQCP